MMHRDTPEFRSQNRLTTSFHTPHDWFSELAETKIGVSGTRFSQTPSETKQRTRAIPSSCGITEFDNEPECRTTSDGGTLFVPECYEARYPYPLLVWLGEASNHWGPFADFMSDLSRRNAFGTRATYCG